jgi:hypothetical protein
LNADAYQPFKTVDLGDEPDQSPIDFFGWMFSYSTTLQATTAGL